MAKHEVVSVPNYGAWRRALGMPIWLVIATTDLSDNSVYKAERAQPLARSTARLLAIALGVPLDLLVHMGPDHKDVRELVRTRAAEIKKQIAAHEALLRPQRQVPAWPETATESEAVAA